MLNYGTVGSNDLPRAVAFYEALLGGAGWTKAFDHPSGGAIFRHPAGTAFGVLGPYDGQPATVGNGAMLGFSVGSPEAVASFHARALELGATCDGAPGNRGSAEMPFHFAYFRDPDGNKLCSYHVPGWGG